MSITNNFLPNWKSVVYIFIPGWISFIPLLILLYRFRISFGIVKLFESYEYLFIFCFINSVGMGLFLNEIGSWIEGYYDKKLVRKYPNHFKNWDKYLLINNSKKKNRSIFSLIDNVVNRMKFGINISLAIILIMIFLIILKANNIILLNICWFIIIQFILFLISVFQLITSYQMAEGLSEYRELLVKKFEK